eukprot:PhF_6_TR26729/c0_g1_i3/m.39186
MSSVGSREGTTRRGPQPLSVDTQSSNHSKDILSNSNSQLNNSQHNSQAASNSPFVVGGTEEETDIPNERIEMLHSPRVSKKKRKQTVAIDETPSVTDDLLSHPPQQTPNIMNESIEAEIPCTSIYEMHLVQHGSPRMPNLCLDGGPSEPHEDKQSRALLAELDDSSLTSWLHEYIMKHMSRHNSVYVLNSEDRKGSAASGGKGELGDYFIPSGPKRKVRPTCRKFPYPKFNDPECDRIYSESVQTKVGASHIHNVKTVNLLVGGCLPMLVLAVVAGLTDLAANLPIVVACGVMCGVCLLTCATPTNKLLASILQTLNLVVYAITICVLSPSDVFYQTAIPYLQAVNAATRVTLLTTLRHSSQFTALLFVDMLTVLATCIAGGNYPGLVLSVFSFSVTLLIVVLREVPWSASFAEEYATNLEEVEFQSTYERECREYLLGHGLNDKFIQRLFLQRSPTFEYMRMIPQVLAVSMECSKFEHRELPMFLAVVDSLAQSQFEICFNLVVGDSVLYLPKEWDLEMDVEQSSSSSSSSMFDMSRRAVAFACTVCEMHDGSPPGWPRSIRCGVGSGEIFDAILGRKDPRRDLWGTAFDHANRMKLNSPPNSTYITPLVFQILQHANEEFLFAFKSHDRVSGKSFPALRTDILLPVVMATLTGTAKERIASGTFMLDSIRRKQSRPVGKTKWRDVDERDLRLGKYVSSKDATDTSKKVHWEKDWGNVVPLRDDAGLDVRYITTHTTFSAEDFVLDPTYLPNAAEFANSEMNDLFIEYKRRHVMAESYEWETVFGATISVVIVCLAISLLGEKAPTGTRVLWGVWLSVAVVVTSSIVAVIYTHLMRDKSSTPGTLYVPLDDFVDALKPVMATSPKAKKKFSFKFKSRHRKKQRGDVYAIDSVDSPRNSFRRKQSGGSPTMLNRESPHSPASSVGFPVVVEPPEPLQGQSYGSTRVFVAVTLAVLCPIGICFSVGPSSNTPHVVALIFGTLAAPSFLLPIMSSRSQKSLCRWLVIGVSVIMGVIQVAGYDSTRTGWYPFAAGVGISCLLTSIVGSAVIPIHIRWWQEMASMDMLSRVWTCRTSRSRNYNRNVLFLRTKAAPGEILSSPPSVAVLCIRLLESVVWNALETSNISYHLMQDVLEWISDQLHDSGLHILQHNGPVIIIGGINVDDVAFFGVNLFEYLGGMMDFEVCGCRMGLVYQKHVDVDLPPLLFPNGNSGNPYGRIISEAMALTSGIPTTFFILNEAAYKELLPMSHLGITLDIVSQQTPVSDPNDHMKVIYSTTDRYCVAHQYRVIPSNKAKAANTFSVKQ